MGGYAINDLDRIASEVAKGEWEITIVSAHTDMIRMVTEHEYELYKVPAGRARHPAIKDLITHIDMIRHGRGASLRDLSHSYDIAMPISMPISMRPMQELLTLRISVINGFGQSMQQMAQALSAFQTSYVRAQMPASFHKKLKATESTELITGYRDFALDDENWCLVSRNSTAWPMREKLVALCNDNPFAEHDAPAEHCECGIYAFNDPRHDSLKVSTANIWGEIYLWGTVLICDTGYRGEYAYPKTLFIRDKGTKAVRFLRDKLAEDYGVPVFLVDERTGESTSDILARMIREGGE